GYRNRLRMPCLRRANLDPYGQPHCHSHSLNLSSATLATPSPEGDHVPEPKVQKTEPDPLSREALNAFDDLFGEHPGFRPVHAKGVLLSGTFIPSSEATSLTNAPHVTRPSTRVELRFSDFAGVPNVP